MKAVALFMGAGASKPFGYPLTNQLLPLIRSNLLSNRLFRVQSLAYLDDAQATQDKLDELSAADRKTFSDCMNIILPGFNSAEDKDLPLITDVLSLVDHSLHAMNSLTPLMSTKALTHFRVLLERAVLGVLAVTSPPSDPLNSLKRLTGWLINKAQSKDHIGIISTNYDIELESQLFKEYQWNKIRNEFDFGFGWRDTVTGAVYKRPTNPSLRIFKLHGSLNWLRCDLCDHVYINTNGEIAPLGYEEVSDGNTCHCNHAPLRSVIVAPSIVRDIRDVNLLECWKSAVEFLRTAEEWIIVGYSFPSEDIAIRSLFLRAYHARATPPAVHVVQKGDALLPRYRLFFPDCTYESGGLEAFIDEVASLDKTEPRAIYRS